MRCEFDYDFSGDSLYIHKRGKAVRYSLELGDDYVIDIGFDGNVVGIEIFNASKIFKIPKYQLRKIDKATISTKFGDPIIIFVHLSLDNRGQGYLCILWRFQRQWR